MKKLISLLLALVLVLGLTACGAVPAPDGSDAQETVMYTDDLGREVEIPAEISRIVATGPVAQVILYAIAPDMFVGLAYQFNATAEGVVPQEYLDLPYFGQLYNSANLNVEELAMVDPQLIIDVGQPMSGGAEDLDTLSAQTNIPAVFVSSSLEDMPATFRTLGKLLGREEKGEALAQFCERVYPRTVSIMEQVGENKVDSLYILGEQGLNVLPQGSYHSELVDMLTNNLAVVDAPSSKGSGNEVTMEQIALWDPEVILFAPDAIYDTAAEMDTWKELTAIQSGSYIKIPEAPHNWVGTPAAVQRYLGMIWLTAQLYPEYCDYDAKAEIMEYYELFYGCKLTEEQYNDLVKDAALN